MHLCRLNHAERNERLNKKLEMCHSFVIVKRVDIKHQMANRPQTTDLTASDTKKADPLRSTQLPAVFHVRHSTKATYRVEGAPAGGDSNIAATETTTIASDVFVSRHRYAVIK
jgi:hypothetical protein